MRAARSLHLALLLAVLACACGSGGCSALIPRENAGIGALEALRGPAGMAATGAKYAGWVVGAPLTLALVPVGALAWATPWVEGGRALGRAMGSPETYVLAGDHQSSGLCFGFILREADAFLLGP